MTDRILTLNAGSSSVKFALFAAGVPVGRALLSGIADGLGSRARLRVRDAAGTVLADGDLAGAGGAAPAHDDALAAILALLRDRAPEARVACVGHRIVHGGTAFDRPVAVDEGVLAALAGLEPLAPLHQPHNLAGVRAARHAFPDVPQVACFDTAFHRAQPELNQRFALPRELHDAGVRRYGFHGLSYESIVAQLEAGGRAARRVVVAHLGHGASMCAMRDGRSVATTMSFSPLDGLPMGTRCGRLDAAVVLYLLGQAMAPEDIAELLYRRSGLLGLSGLSGEMRELLASAEPAAREAVDYYVEHACRELAAMCASLDGLDLLVFTGGIGENAASLRARIVARLAWMGLALDEAANARGEELVSAPGSACAVRVLHTDEEAVIARHAARFVRGP
ncbi:MAG: acetate kinase [Betaproteobacteria bacterium]|nr:MAG: acetate kinase [Betaproteobacteria bacterium]